MKNIGKTNVRLLLEVFLLILVVALGSILGAHSQLVEFAAVVAACVIVVFLVGIFLFEIRSKLNNICAELNNICTEFSEGDEQKMSWRCFWETTTKLQELIQADESFKPAIILSVGRSGSVVGSILAGNMKGLPCIGIDRINHWPTSGGELKRTVEIFPPLESLAEVLQGKNILCVMSECDTGRTLENLVTELNKIDGIGQVKTAVLYRNEITNFGPDYVAVIDNGKRPDFPFRTSTWRGDNKAHVRSVPKP